MLKYSNYDTALNEIVTAINNTVNNGTKGVFEIKNEIIDLNEIITTINNTIHNGTSGLPEIKNEIIDINRIVNAINNTVNNGTKGVFEIKNEIIQINEAINDLFEAINNINISGGGCLNDVIIAINNTVNNGEKGVFEIKNEIIELNEAIQIINNNTQSAFTGTLTTGPIFLPTSGQTDILTKVLNNNANNRTVNITLFSLINCPKEVFASNSLTLPACCANEITMMSVPRNYEVQVSGVVPGVYVFTTASQGGSDNVITATVRHSQFVPQVGNGTCVE